MKRRRLALFLGAMVAAAGLASAHHMHHHMHQGRMGMPAYDSAKEITIEGTVAEVQTGSGMMMGVLAQVTTAPEKTMTVFLGPARFLERQKFSVTKGDELKITGAPIERAGREFFLAREVRKGDVTLVLRDTRGMPKWAGHMRR